MGNTLDFKNKVPSYRINEITINRSIFEKHMYWYLLLHEFTKLGCEDRDDYFNFEKLQGMDMKNC